VKKVTSHKQPLTLIPGIRNILEKAVQGLQATGKFGNNWNHGSMMNFNHPQKKACDGLSVDSLRDSSLVSSTFFFFSRSSSLPTIFFRLPRRSDFLGPQVIIKSLQNTFIYNSPAPGIVRKFQLKQFATL